VPTLTEVFHLCRDRVRINIELKGMGSGQEGLPAAVFDLCVRENMLDQVCFSSFQHEYYDYLVQHVKAQNRSGSAEIPSFGFLVHKPDEFPNFDMLPLGAGNSLNLPAKFAYNPVTVPKLVQARERGLDLNVYFSFDTVEHDFIYDHLLDLGVSSIITNQPRTLMRYK